MVVGDGANDLDMLGSAGLGGVLALASYVPILNLLIPVVGTAAMVHLLDRAL